MLSQPIVLPHIDVRKKGRDIHRNGATTFDQVFTEPIGDLYECISRQIKNTLRPERASIHAGGEKNIPLLITTAGYVVLYDDKGAIRGLKSVPMGFGKFGGGKSYAHPLVEVCTDAVNRPLPKNVPAQLVEVLDTPPRINGFYEKEKHLDRQRKLFETLRELHTTGGLKELVHRLGLDSKETIEYLEARMGLKPEEPFSLEKLLYFRDELHAEAAKREVVEEFGYEVVASTLRPFLEIVQIKYTSKGNPYVKDCIFYTGQEGQKVGKPMPSMSEQQQGLRPFITASLEAFVKEQDDLLASKFSSLKWTGHKRLRFEKIGPAILNSIAGRTAHFLNQKGHLSLPN